jgi:hypothetical protein
MCTFFVASSWVCTSRSSAVRTASIAYVLDDSTTVVLHNPAKSVVAVMDHHQAGSISIFFEICGRPLNVGKHYRDRATKLFELFYAGGVFPR